MNFMIHQATLLPMTAEGDAPKCFAGSIAVEGNRIALITNSEEEAAAYLASHPACRVIEGRGRLVMPGLINTHCHAAMSLQRNRADDIALMEWLNDHIWPFEAKQTAEEIATGMELGVVELLLGGVTSFVDMYFHEARCVEVVRRLGIRALLGCSYFDNTLPIAEADAEAAVQAAKGCDRIGIALAPHAPYTVSRERLIEGKRFAEEHNLPVMIHVAETEAEMAYVREHYDRTPVEFLDEIGLLDERTIAAHCVWVDAKDRATLRERGVVVSHNAQSNMKLSSGAAPIAAMVAEGLQVTLATDGPCSNNDLDLWEEMRSAAYLQKLSTGNPLVLPAYEVLKMVTVNGARAMGYTEQELGTLREGALADLIMIDLRKPHLQPINDPVADLVYCAKASDVELVVVDGEIVVEDRKVRGVDPERLYQRATEAVQRINRA